MKKEVNYTYTLTDIVTLGQGDRGTMEFTYPKTGMFMSRRSTNLGWTGMFNVTDKPMTTISSSRMSSYGTALHNSKCFSNAR